MQQTKEAKLRAEMRKRWVDPIIARDKCGILNCLSQRAGDFKREGLNVVSKWIKDKSGRNVCKAYRILPGAQ